jgi:hypothetical protein
MTPAGAILRLNLAASLADADGGGHGSRQRLSRDLNWRFSGGDPGGAQPLARGVAEAWCGRESACHGTTAAGAWLAGRLVSVVN